MSEIGDGVYQGIYESNLVSAEVDVFVSENMIVKIIITRHETLFGKDAKRVIDDIIQNQSLEVDDVAGATYSSEVVKRAIQDALNS